MNFILFLLIILTINHCLANFNLSDNFLTKINIFNEKIDQVLNTTFRKNDTSDIKQKIFIFNDTSLNDTDKNDQLSELSYITFNIGSVLNFDAKYNKSNLLSDAQSSVDFNKKSQANQIFTPKDCGRSFDIEFNDNLLESIKYVNSDFENNDFLLTDSNETKFLENLESITRSLHPLDNYKDDNVTLLQKLFKQKKDFNLIGEKRIINGYRANPGQFPWQASIQILLRNPKNLTQTYWKHVCGGSIINSHWILTAAHCLEFRRLQSTFRPKIKPKISVVIGSLSWNNSENVGQRIMVADYTKYYQTLEAFGQYLQMIYDIALLKLDSPIQFGTGTNGVGAVERICLPEPGDNKINEYLRISGWGSTSQYPVIRVPLHLRALDLPSVSDRECELRYWPLRNKKHFLCAGYLGDTLLRGICMGDSGSPLIQRDKNDRNVQIGIVSGGRLPCGSGTFPGTFSRISVYRDWIKLITGT